MMPRKPLAFAARLWIVSLAMGAAVAARGGEIDDALADVLIDTPSNRFVPVIVHLEAQVDLRGLTARLDEMRTAKQARHELLIRALRETAAASQSALRAELEAEVATGEVESFDPLWITNAIAVRAKPDAIRRIADRPDVAIVFLDHPVSGAATQISDVRSADSSQGDPLSGEVEHGVAVIRAPEVWALGYTGTGVVVSHIDTGADGNHAAFADRWRGLDARYADHPEWAFFDPWESLAFPIDRGSHGTHVMGTMCGGSPGDSIGVAPGAEWITASALASGNIQTLISNIMRSFQWIADPDGDPGTDFDVPAVCANSWGLSAAHGLPPCDERFWGFIDAVEAAGVVVLFSANEDGQGGIARPADRASDEYNTLATGAVNAHVEGWPAPHFSPRGPSECTPDGGPAIKPELAAPGVDVRSAIPGDGYQRWSGSSMPTPHVAGVVALMVDANPELTVNQIKQILYDTAYDLGDEGEDNTYGWGMVDAYEAVRMALSMDGCTRDPAWICDGDVDGDGQVNPVDSGLVQAAFCSGDDCPVEALCQYDMDCDGQINPVDSGIVQSLFGTCAAPRDVCP